MQWGTEKTTQHSLQIGVTLNLRASIDLPLAEGVGVGVWVEVEEVWVEALFFPFSSLSLSVSAM